VSGGSFTYTSSGNTFELLSNVTVTVSNPSLLSSLTLTATFDESNPSVTVTPPTSTTVFTFNPPLSIPPNSTVNFSLSAVIAGKSAAAAKAGLIQTLFKGTNSDGGFYGGGFAHSPAVQTMAGHLRDILPLSPPSGSALLMLLGAIVPMLLMTFVFQGGIRQRIVAAGFGMFIATMSMTMTGCDPCPACTTAKLKSTVQTLVAVTSTDGEGNPFSVTGIPVNLSQLSK